MICLNAGFCFNLETQSNDQRLEMVNCRETRLDLMSMQKYFQIRNEVFVDQSDRIGDTNSSANVKWKSGK